MRLPFFYGWIIVVVTFVTMAIGVNARTAFSLFFPPIIDEFGWERGITAGAFSFGFLGSGAVSPLVGRLVDRSRPRPLVGLGVSLVAGGPLVAPPPKPPPRPLLPHRLHSSARLGRHRLDPEARASHRAFLVDFARLFLRIVYLVRGAGSPDQISARHRLQSERRGLGIGRGQSARYPRPDLARTPLRPAGA